MSPLIFSPKHGGNGHSKSFDDSSVRPTNDSYPIPAYTCRTVLLFAIVFFGFSPPSLQAFFDTRAQSVSASASIRCNQKLKKIENFTAREEADKELTTRLTEEEINSYLTLDLNSKHQSCLKNVRMAFKQDLIEGIASVDFDCLKQASSNTFSFLLMKLLSGTHLITTRGTLLSGNGKGSIQLERTRFDDSTIPNILVKEAIAAVCKKQDPPFNPMESTQLPFNIKKITIHPGYIMVYQ